MKFLGMNISSDAESVKILYNYSVELQNMQSVSMPVQVF